MAEIALAYDPFINPKQVRFHACDANECFFGGSKGPGKTCALVMDCFQYAMTYPKSECYLFRETFDELERNIINEWKTKVPAELYKLNESKHVATLINGSRVYFRFCDCKEDASKYDGSSIDYIGVDELTKHQEEEIQILLSCLRSPKGYPPRFRSTSNPGGPGHKWVKKRYVTPTHKGERMYRDTKTNNVIAFIPATVYDNSVLMKNDPAYARRLENLPPAKKKALLYGDWDSYEGQAFEEFDPAIHVIKPFIIPDHWRKWISVDNGMADPFCWLWFAVDEDGFIYIYREFTRTKHDERIGYSDQARRVIDLSTFTRYDEVSKQDEKVIENWDFIVAGHDAWSEHHRDTEGKTLIDYYQDGGLHSFIRGDTDRKIRKGTWHEYLQVDPEIGPRLKIFSTCRYLIRSIPMLQEDEMDSDKVSDAPASDNHGYDCCLTGDTLVDTVDGQLAIKDLVGKRGYVYCCNKNDSGIAAIGKFHDVRCTQKDVDVYEVELEDGRSIKATAEHQILTAEGWRSLQDLTCEDEIIDLAL